MRRIVFFMETRITRRINIFFQTDFGQESYHDFKGNLIEDRIQ